MIDLFGDSFSDSLYETLISIKPAVLRSAERVALAISQVVSGIYEEMNRGDEVPEEVLRRIQARPISPILGNELGEYAISHPLLGEQEVVTDADANIALIEWLENLDDVDAVYHNMKVET